LLAGLLMDSDPKAFASLFPVAEQQAAGAIPVFQAELTRRLMTDENQPGSEQLKDELAQRQARAAVALIRLGHAGEVWPLLRHSADPLLRSFLVNWLNPLGADPKTLAAELARLDSSPRPAERGEGARRAGEGSSNLPRPAERGEGARRAGEGSGMDAVLFHPEAIGSPFRGHQIALAEKRDPRRATQGGLYKLFQKGDWLRVFEVPVPFLKQPLSVRSEVVQRLLAQKCELCGAEGSCQVHHVRKLADLNQPVQSDEPLWVKRMAARHRNTLVVCQSCHEAIHRERLNRHSFKTKATGEPR
jgi:hypothetical protein